MANVYAIDTTQGAFDERVRSMQVYNPDDFYAPAVIRLGTDDRLVFSFDILSEDREYLRYDILHCNADWQPSGIVESEYIDGFNLADVNDYAFSEATGVHYVHYTIEIPNDDIMPMISGNYLLRVFPENDPDDVLAQFRFMVSEQTAIIEGGVSTRTDKDYNKSHQQLSLAIDTERSQVVDPFNDLIVKIQQNGRIDNETTLNQPLRMQGKNLSIYEHQDKLIFNAGNEYRRFEAVSSTYPGMHVENIRYQHPYYNYTLATDEPRAESMYLYDQTQHGRFRIREYNSDDSDVEADYGIVHFTLEMPEIPNAKVYLEGDFTNRRYDDNALMKYNRSKGCYERSMLLKQGAYNYQYVVVSDGSSTGFTAPIEGDHYQTTNEYLVKVYTRHPGDRYDRLIGVSRIMSN